MINFEGNSNNQKVDNTPKKNIQPVGVNVQVKKESEARKLAKNFISEDYRNVKSHVFDEVVVPGIKRLVSDVIKNAIDWLLYGVAKGPTSAIGNGIRGLEYNRIYNSAISNRGGYTQQSTQLNNTRSGIRDLDVISFDSRSDAELVLIRLQEVADTYELVSVADFYDIIGQTHSFTDNNWGWADLSNAKVVLINGRWVIKFPPIKPLK